MESKVTRNIANILTTHWDNAGLVSNVSGNELCST